MRKPLPDGRGLVIRSFCGSILNYSWMVDSSQGYGNAFRTSLFKMLNTTLKASAADGPARQSRAPAPGAPHPRTHTTGTGSRPG